MWKVVGHLSRNISITKFVVLLAKCVLHSLNLFNAVVIV
jgi:hypothetical protein